MLKLKDKNKKIITGLTNYKDLCIESTLSTGDKKLSFSLHKKDKFYGFIEEECYIETKTQEYVIKARDVGVDYTRFDCVLNLEELEANIFDRFESVEQTITNALNLAIVGTGWTVKSNTLKKKRTVRCTNKNALEIVQEIKKTYRVDIVFNTLSKQIEIHEKLGEDKGTYFIDSLNLTALQVQSDSYKFATRIMAEGKDGLTFSSINNGKNYVENYQYSKKVKTLYWKDERYTIKESLLEDAKAKLEEISKPFISYNASILNLAELNPKYKNILDYKLGDTITLISRNNKVKDKQRVVKTVEYPNDHSRDTVELANATLKFEDIQQENQETTDTVNNITTDNGTVDGSTIDSITTKQIEDFEANVIKVAKLKAILAEIENLHVNKADIQNLNAVIARIGTLEATKASITELNAIHAIIQQIKAGKADITDLNAAVAKVGILENKTAVLENALAGNLTADNFKTNAITAGSAVIAEGAIGSSQISSLSVNKLEAGDITTSKHKIVSADGTIEIVGNQILINRNNVNRVILGEYRKLDGTTEYGLLVRAKDGQTIMLDGNGVHNAGITDGAIDNNKVADNANISGNKLDINSVIREVNNNGTETIKGTKVTVGDRTLDVELSTQKNTITEHSKELSSQKASLTALDNALKFKVDSQTFTQSTETINSNINRAKEEAINTANSNTTNAINNMEVGAENLLDDSEKERTNYPNVRGEYLSVNITDIIKSNLGKQIVLSGEIKSLGKDGSITIYSLGKYQFNNSKTVKCTTKEFIPFELVITPTYNPSGDNGEVCNWSFYGVYGSGIYPCIRKLKVSLGNKKSSWSPSANDLKRYSDDVAKAKADLAQANAIANADGKITAEEQKRIQQAQENLNTAISKADKAKQDAILEANRVSELKKQEAINSANSHADSKANEALNDAKAFVNAEITTVNTHLKKATAEINVLKEKIESKVSQSDIDKSIQEIKIGGRNLFLDSDLQICTKSKNWFDNFKSLVTTENNLNYATMKGTQWFFGQYVELEEGQTYTASCLARVNKASQLKSFLLHIKLDAIANIDYVINKSCTDKFQRLSYTFVWNRANAKERIHFLLRDSSAIVDIALIKLEKGNKATDWTPAPEDMNQLIIDNIKTVTDKISTVESKFTQENNSIKASVQDLNSTTQSITTNVSNINRDLTSKINSNLDVAKNFATDIAIAKANLAKEQAIANADGKITEEERKRIAEAKKNLDTAIARADKAKQDAINTASTDATNKANNALNSAKAFVNAEITTVNNKVHNVESNIDILKNKIALKVEQSDIDKTKTELINKINVVDNLANNAKDLASAMSLGKMLFSDPTFKNSSNNIKTYNNNGNGTVTTSRISKINGCPTDSQYCIEVKTVGSASPNHGGFYFGNMTRANAIFVTKIIAKIPVGLRIGWYSNSTGNNGSSKWLTSVNGTGKWEEYIHLLKCGDTGNFSSTSFFALDGGITPSTSNPIVWHLAYATVFDITENDESVNVLKTEMSTAKNKVATIETNLDNITQRVSSTESKTHSIETTLGGKASKQEVTEVNNRVATIKASLDGITQRVSATESKTQTLETNLNGKASKQEVNNVSSKVVSLEANLSGITNRVSNTESRINSVDGKVNNATTRQEFTEFKQGYDNFKLDVSKNFGSKNLIRNSGFLYGYNYFYPMTYEFDGHLDLAVWTDSSEWVVSDTCALTIRGGNFNRGCCGARQDGIKLKPNTKYTIAFSAAAHRCKWRLSLNTNGWGQLVWTEGNSTGGKDPNNWDNRSITFVTGPSASEITNCKLDLVMQNRNANDPYAWFTNLILVEGEFAPKWTPMSGESYSNTVIIDQDKVKTMFENGTYAQMGRDGFEWYNSGTGHSYHALAYVTSLGIPAGNPGRAYVRLPVEFTKRRKSLKWTVALRGYYYSTSGDFFPMHVHVSGTEEYEENGILVCPIEGYCKIQNAQNSGDIQFRPVTAMLIAVA
ncbi:phage tail spike protein [Clostridium perfringens]|uniref:phage tail spike protein n=1 Tax=Clostridium perfringens TaxID=1502 RepID=UPI0024BCFB9F|nr:phage tail spike protein [Clostridium perfringens]